MKLFLFPLLAGCFATVLFQTASEQETKNEPVAESKAATVSEASDDAEDDESELATFMRKKLKSSNRIMEGLVMDDLSLVTKACDELLDMSEAESWRATNDMMYMQHSREFRSSVRALEVKAKKKSLDGSALAWLDVTLECIKCHEWVRDTMLADVADPFRSPKPAKEDSDD